MEFQVRVSKVYPSGQEVRVLPVGRIPIGNKMKEAIETSMVIIREFDKEEKKKQEVGVKREEIARVETDL